MLHFITCGYMLENICPKNQFSQTMKDSSIISFIFFKYKLFNADLLNTGTIFSVAFLLSWLHDVAVLPWCSEIRS